jgi:hypothetical protein
MALTTVDPPQSGLARLPSTLLGKWLSSKQRQNPLLSLSPRHVERGRRRPPNIPHLLLFVYNRSNITANFEPRCVARGLDSANLVLFTASLVVTDGHSNSIYHPRDNHSAMLQRSKSKDRVPSGNPVYFSKQQMGMYSHGRLSEGTTLTKSDRRLSKRPSSKSTATSDRSPTPSIGICIEAQFNVAHTVPSSGRCDPRTVFSDRLASTPVRKCPVLPPQAICRHNQ